MANTYTQIHIHAIFAVQFRAAVIGEHWKNDLYKYITAIVQNNRHKLISINGMPDHIHMLIGTRPDQSLSNLMREIKAGSSKWINENKFLNTRFQWQQGFGAFAYGRSQIPSVCAYIENQARHHQNISFREEYIRFLKVFEVEFDDRYILTEPQ